MEDETFGIEIEFHIPSEKLIDYEKLINHNISFDGVGSSISEIRTDVFRSLEEAFLSGKFLLGRVDHPIKSPLHIYFCSDCETLHFLPMSIHVSVGRKNKVKWLMAFIIYLFFPVLVPGWKNKLLYIMRRLIYPDFYKVHNNRIEFRFFPPDVPLAYKYAKLFM